MKPYKIFVSYSKFDAPIAETVASLLNNYFKGYIKVFFAPKDIQMGAKWKEVILDALKEYDAIISIISPSTYEKPWLIAEFTAFWLQDKDIYILKYGDLDFSKLFPIFTNYQICDMQDKNNVTGLIEVLSEKSNTIFSPFDKVEEFLVRMEGTIHNTLTNRSFSLSMHAKTIEIHQREIVAIAEKIPKDAKLRRNMSKSEVSALAREIGLFNAWSINPQLTYEDGDIVWYSQQDYTRLKIEADFRAKFLVLTLAEREKVVIRTQGDLSNIAKGLIGEIIREWENKQS